MEIQFNFTPIWKSPIERLDQTSLQKFNPRRYWAVEKVLDKMGALSAQAQGLKKVITSFDRVLDSDEEQVVYILWEPTTDRSACSTILGMLKIGRKHLYLLDDEQQNYEENPWCVLDFFVHPSKQRAGYGNALFDFMLVSEVLQPYELAFDRPSEALINFLEKKYTLSNPVWQATNIAVFPSFFDDKKAIMSDDRYGGRSRDVSSRMSACPTPSPRRLAHPSRRESAAAIIHGEAAPEVRPFHGPDTPQGRKNTRDFGHTSLW